MSSHAKVEIPTIDLQSWLDGSDPDDVVSKVRSACMTYGFMQVTGHNVPLAMQRKAFECAKTFFALPPATKLSMKKDPVSGRGYEPIGSQGLQSADMPDEKEAMRIGRDVLAHDPKFGTPFYGANQWPNLPEEVFRKPIMEYREYLLQLAKEIMHILARGLPYDCDAAFNEFMLDPVASVKMIHYPPRPSDGTVKLGAGAHTDFGAITILLQHPGQEGLEVLHPTVDTWIPVPTAENTFVINIGDVLSAWTGGQYRSAVHRVINRCDGDRYSIPFFFDGTMTTKMVPLDGSGGNQEEKTIGQHFQEKFAAAAVKA